MVKLSNSNCKEIFVSSGYKLENHYKQVLWKKKTFASPTKQNYARLN